MRPTRSRAAFSLRGPATSISRNTLRRPRAEASARLMFLSGEVSSKDNTIGRGFLEKQHHLWTRRARSRNTFLHRVQQT